MKRAACPRANSWRKLWPLRGCLGPRYPRIAAGGQLSSTSRQILWHFVTRGIAPSRSLGAKLCVFAPPCPPSLPGGQAWTVGQIASCRRTSRTASWRRPASGRRGRPRGLGWGACVWVASSADSARRWGVIIRLRQVVQDPAGAGRPSFGVRTVSDQLRPHWQHALRPPLVMGPLELATQARPTRGGGPGSRSSNSRNGSSQESPARTLAGAPMPRCPPDKSPRER